jgi:RNA polymerase sigma-70 factor (ECF subfamily)
MTLDPPHPSLTDADLMAGIAVGDKGAFGELYRRRRGDVYRFALRVTGSPPLAEDVAQDVFLAVMRDAARYQPGRSAVVVWLCGIARNCARRRLDRERTFQPLAAVVEREEAQPAERPDPLAGLTRAEGIARLRRTLLALPLPYREVIVLCDLQELSYAEAAEAIGCRVGTVRSRLHRGRELLAAKMLTGREQDRPAPVTGTRCTA